MYNATGLVGMKHHSVKLNAVLAEFYSAILCLKKEHEQAYYKANKLSPARNDNVPVEFYGGGKEHEQVYHKLAITSQK